MKRPWRVWLVFGLSLSVMLAVTAWVSWQVLRLDAAQWKAQQQAEVEEAVRLALWRMDAAAIPLIAQESARPYFVYTPFYPAERAYTRMYNKIPAGEVLVPSPLLAGAGPGVRLHFQIDPAGRFSSPQVPAGQVAPTSGPEGAADPAGGPYSERLAELPRHVAREALLEALAALPPQSVPPVVAGAPVPTVAVGGQRFVQKRSPEYGAPRLRQDQFQRGVNEYRGRQQVTGQSVANVWLGNSLNMPAPLGNVQEGPMRPVWMGEALVLGRRILVNGRVYVQGCWLDWPDIQRQLLATVRELLPDARLEPDRPGAEGQARRAGRLGRALATLPVRLAPGWPNVAGGRPTSPLRLSLLAGWGCLLLAAAAVAVLLSGVLSLSQRRADFVSAVTHELRTPLTTFRLYTEMLADGQVRDEAKRARYLATLRAEAERLSHLVQNVLTYAGLEANRAGRPAERVAFGDLLERVRPGLADRAEQAGMSLLVDADDELSGASLRIDPAAVEHILFNLVDNACKYASAASDKRIHLDAERHRGRVTVRVRDHGPGIGPIDTRRLFRPFSKSARAAAGSAPGVGLGLSLARRLARRMGGDLHIIDTRHAGGACFVLTLPESST